MRVSHLLLFLFFVAVVAIPMIQGQGGEEQYVRGTKPTCKKPTAKVGESFIRMNFHCVKNKNSAPQIRIDLENTCETEEPSCPAQPKPFQDPPLLIAGPGWRAGQYGMKGSSELFSLPPVGEEEEVNITLPVTECYIPTYPHSEWGFVGFTLGGTLTICGGEAVGNFVTRNTCRSLANFTWTASTPMLHKRLFAATAILPNQTVVISGGYSWDNRGYTYLSSTELYTGEVSQEGALLPYPVNAHCMVYLQNHLIIIGGRISGHGDNFTSATYSYNLNDSNGWTKQASMNIPRGFHACSVLEGEVWVGGSKRKHDTEIYTFGTNTWRHGPLLPYKKIYPGEFVTHGKLLFYVGGRLEKRIHLLNKEKDGWIFVREMAEAKFWLPALVVTESACYGVSYRENVGVVGGSMQEILNSLTDSSLEVEVSCCVDGELVARTCGLKDDDSLVTCKNICGKTNDISAILDIEEDDSSICDPRSPTVPIYSISYCVRRVTTLQALDRNRVCCLHPYVSRKPGVKDKCCKSFGWCF